MKDKFGLGIQEFFEDKNPAALEEMTAVMLESVRKGLWKAGEQQVADIARLHTELVNKYKPSCSGFVCDNAKLRDFIASKVNSETAAQYKENVRTICEAAASADNSKATVLKKEEMNAAETEEQTNRLSNTIVMVGVVIAVIILIIVVRRRRNRLEE